MSGIGILSGFDALPRVDLNRERSEERKRTLTRSRRHIAVLSVLLVIGPCLLVPATRQIIGLQAHANETRRQISRTDANLQRITQTSDQIDARLSLWNRLEQSKMSRRVWDAAMASLAASLPDDVLLQRVEISQRDGGLEIAAQGSAESMDGLQSFMKLLAASSLLAHVRLTETTAAPAAGRHEVEFKISGPVTAALSAP